MESRIGSILLLISAIITFILGGLMLLITFIIPFIPDAEGDGIILAIIFGVIAVLILGVGVVKLWASRLMRNPEKTSFGGIIAIVAGVISGGDMFAIIGGIVGIMQSEQQSQSPPARNPRARKV